MSQTLSIPSPSADERATGRVLLRNISWDKYSKLLEEIGDDATRLTYDHGLLEIEVPSIHQEQVKTLLGSMIEAFLTAEGRDFEPVGSVTWRRFQALRGLESDECYYIRNFASIQGKSAVDLAVDPPPDLAVEIDFSSSSINKLEIYKTLCIPEIWRVLPDLSCEFLCRHDEGTYHQASSSPSMLRLTPEVVSNYVRMRERLGHSPTLRNFASQVLAQLRKAS